MGFPGSGKGKQAEMLARKLKCKIFSTGNRVREISKEDTSLGRIIKEISESGDLTPSWFASFLFEEVLFSLKDVEGIIFEGVGRKEPEARLFTEVCQWLGRDFRVLHLKVSEATVAERLRKRQGIEDRSDDDPSVFQNRLENFYEHTVPTIEYFRSINKVIDVDGGPLPEAVFAELWQKVSAL